MKIYLLEQESCENGDYIFNVNAFKDIVTARKMMREEIDEILSGEACEGHYASAKDFMDGKRSMDRCDFKWEDEYENGFYIKDLYADYHELITIREVELITKESFKNRK